MSKSPAGQTCALWGDKCGQSLKITSLAVVKTWKDMNIWLSTYNGTMLSNTVPVILCAKVAVKCRLKFVMTGRSICLFAPMPMVAPKNIPIWWKGHFPWLLVTSMPLTWQFPPDPFSRYGFIAYRVENGSSESQLLKIYNFVTVTLTHLPLDKMATILTDHIFNCIFLIENDKLLIQISLNLVPSSPINNKSALVRVMARRRSGDKPLPGPKMTQFTDAYMRH